MKDSQRSSMMEIMPSKYIKANNERFSTSFRDVVRGS